MIYTHRFVMIRVCDFMMKYAAPKKLYSSLEPKDINAFTIDTLKQNQSALSSDVLQVYRQLC